MYCCANGADGAHSSCICIFPLPYQEFPLQLSPNLTEVSKNGRKLNICDSTRHTGGDPMLLEAAFVSRERITLYKINHPASSQLRLCTPR